MRFAPGFFLALLACHEATELETPQVAGRWTFSEVLTDGLHGITCTSTGTYAIEQEGTTFSGSYQQTGQCEDRNGDVRDNPGHGPLTNGRIQGLSIRFAIPPTCEYDGLLAGDRITGRGLCEITDGVQTFSYFGTWEAVR
jgi:hypothetical protein